MESPKYEQEKHFGYSKNKQHFINYTTIQPKKILEEISLCYFRICVCDFSRIEMLLRFVSVIYLRIKFFF
jgi:hypothetical protein